MSYFITAISNGGGAPEQAYRKLQSAGACPEAPYAGTQIHCQGNSPEKIRSMYHCCAGDMIFV